MGPGILPETTVGKHNPPCHLQMPTKALSSKNEAICKNGPEAHLCPVGQGSFKMDCFKVEKCSMVRRVQIWHSFWTLRSLCPLSQRGGRPSSMLSVFSSKASISYGMGVRNAYGNRQLECFGRHYECWKVYKGFRATYAPPQMTSISEKGLCISAGQQHGFVVEESGCWIGLPAIQIFHL